MSKPTPQHPTMEFHVSRQARDRYGFDSTLFSLTGNVIFADFHATRVFAQRMNEKRDLLAYPERAVRSGQLNAMGLIDEILHLVVDQYRKQRNPQAVAGALRWLEQHLASDLIDDVLLRFVVEFPSVAVYRGTEQPEQYLAGSTAGVPHKQVVLEELMLLWLANLNPAFSPFCELFDDSRLVADTAYRAVANALQEYFEAQPTFGPSDQDLITMLRGPAIAEPHSLPGQLEYIRLNWGWLLGADLYRLLGSLDLIREEQKAVFAGPGPSLVPEFSDAELEPERFSPDSDWMPQLVLMAKNAYVWLDQLSRKYQQPINRLDQIPDQELDMLARWGMSGLWLIGLWERSPASQRIKQLCGNPDAVASAYSLHDYTIAADLGGQSALENLRSRAWQRGIRLASDMVPNHVGITSRWVTEHPEWFVRLDHSPFPSYTFDGPNLSDDPAVAVHLEDHYYSRSDAAVVFKRRDNWSGREDFIYHGNDGTSMPWNDTAQLDYLNPEVREVVIQTILHVARQFPVIRFDAAMTLTKKHFQRLWYPEPGTGGAIPTRAEHGLTKSDFDAAMPKEFWRELVDRVAEEVPDTLLLAEAFWLLEGYFVRTLGMHRVYNSAFMHMLRDEDNAKYRTVIKNTLEFDPEVLKRYVNFMNNPDEDTAAEQFGKGDKYFGICTLLATMPGLPMFGHGQIEGFSEKYGMEYRRAYWDETPGQHLIDRHEREVFPLLHRRRLFAEVERFTLYDFFDTSGQVNEDVFAYSNQSGSDRALVVYHNRFATARGWIKDSAAFSTSAGPGQERVLRRRPLSEGLNLSSGENTFSIFRDQLSGLEYLRSNHELREAGLYIELEAYKCHVFLDWQQVQDNEWRQYAHLAAYLNGRGVPSIENALREVFLQPVHDPLRQLVGHDTISTLIWLRTPAVSGTESADDMVSSLESLGREAIDASQRLIGGAGDSGAILSILLRKLRTVLRLPSRPAIIAPLAITNADAILAQVSQFLSDDVMKWGILNDWLWLHLLGRVVDGDSPANVSRTWIDEWQLGRLVSSGLHDSGLDQGAVDWSLAMIKPLVTHQDWWTDHDSPHEQAYAVLRRWLSDIDVQQILQVNRHRDVLWFNDEGFAQWLDWMMLVAALDIVCAPNSTPQQVMAALENCRALIDLLRQAADSSGYRVSQLLDATRMAAAAG